MATPPPFILPPQIDLTPEPDLHPIYPTAAFISLLLSGDSGLNPSQKTELVAHSAHRACIFADLQLLQFLALDAQAQAFLDLGNTDEDGLTLADVAIMGFGAESDRDVEREECVRFLVGQGLDVNHTDNAGWTALHHAALTGPPTLISYLLTHGSSPLVKTVRGLMPLDIVTAHSIIPGREDVALLLEEAMRYGGWTGGKMEQTRRELEARSKRRRHKRDQEDVIASILDIDSWWWNRPVDLDAGSDVSEDDSEDIAEADSVQYTPPADYESMLVFEPDALPAIFQSIISNYRPRRQDTTPANSLYLMARFACLTCDHTWLEDLIVGATDAIEETFYNAPEDVPTLLFWLHNTTTWLHLMRCDLAINEACELLGSFVLVEEVINSVFVFIIRFAERRIDQLLDAAFLEYLPPSSQAEDVQFESEWSFLKSFKKKPAAPSTPEAISRQRSATLTPSTSGSVQAFQSLRQSMSRVRSPTATPLQGVFNDVPAPVSPHDVVSFIMALHTFMISSSINPALITQLWSQVIYWTACEAFNRLLTRKKYLCRSRAREIAVNIAVLDDCISAMGLPNGIHTHFAPVRDLLNWLQTLSSIDDFPTLISTIQQLSYLNPLQMRRAVREYKYEVNENKLQEEFVQYLAQIQKDWERQRVKLGVEALRKEIDERDRDGSEQSFQDSSNDGESRVDDRISVTSNGKTSIDILFDRELGMTDWLPAQPPQVLGELLDSRFMLPLLLPSDPKHLSAVSGKLPNSEPVGLRSPGIGQVMRPVPTPDHHSVLAWKSKGKALRDVDVDLLQRIDGPRRRSAFAHVHYAYTETVMPSPVEGRNPFSTDGDDHLDGPSGLIARRRSARHARLRSGDGGPNPPPVAEFEVLASPPPQLESASSL